MDMDGWFDNSPTVCAMSVNHGLSLKAPLLTATDSDASTAEVDILVM